MGTNLPAIATILENNIDLKLHRIRHRVDRFGVLYDYVIEATSVNDSRKRMFRLHSDTPVEEIYDLMALKEGEEFTVASSSYNPNTDNLPIAIIAPVHPANDQAVCDICAKPLKESLGELVCSDVACDGRNISRVYHFFLNYGIFKDRCELNRFVNLELMVLGTSVSISGAIYSLCCSGIEEYGKAAGNVKDLLTDMDILLSKISFTDNDSLVKIIEFFYSLSLPSITMRDVTNAVFTAAKHDNVAIIVDTLSRTMDKNGEDEGGWFWNELDTLTSYIKTRGSDETGEIDLIWT